MLVGTVARHLSRITRSEFSRLNVRPRSCAVSTKTEESSAEVKVRESRFVQPLREAITKHKVVDWDRIRNHVFPAIVENVGGFQVPFATAIFLTLANKGCKDHLRQFVQNTGIENLSVTHLAKYMRYCDDPEEIMRCWEVIRGKRSLFTDSELTNICAGILRTREWKLVIELNKNYALQPSRTVPFQIAHKYFELKRYDEGIEWLNAQEDMEISFVSNPIMEDAEMAEKFLDYICKRRSCIYEEFEIAGNKSWETHYNIKETQVVSSTCMDCGVRLPSGSLTPQDILLLKETVRSRILKQKDIYLNTTPIELQRFEHYLQKQGPFDVVIDGLNLIYRYKEPVTIIQAVIQEYTRKDYKNILVLGRNHAMQMYRSLRLPPTVKHYTLADLTKDDPFILLAAFSSGPDCRVLSSDFFRDHTHKLKAVRLEDPNDRSYELFRTWLSIRKDTASPMNRFYDQWKPRTKPLRFAPRHFIMPFADPEGWHIPYTFKIGKPMRWICVRRRTKADK